MKSRVVKNLLVVALFVSVFTGLCVATESNGRVSAKMLAAQIVVNKIRDGFKSLSVSQKDLSAKMKDNLEQKFTDPDQSWVKLRDAEKAQFEKAYKEEIQALLKKLDSDKPEGVDSWFSAKDWESFLTPPKEAIEQSLNANFGEKYSPEGNNVFNGARKEVVAEQQKSFIFGAYPKEDDLEDPKISRQKLETNLANAIIAKQGKIFLFQENKTAIGGPGVVGRIIDDARAQQKAQKQIVEQSDGGQKISPKEIEEAIGLEIGEYRANLEKEKVGEKVANHVYGIFRSVKESIPERGKTLAVSKFIKTISDRRVTIEARNMMTWMTQDIGKHTKTDKSLELCLVAYRSVVCDRAVSDCVNQVESGKQKDFRDFLEKTVASDASCKVEIDKLVRRSVNEVFGKARDEISDAQVKEFFDPLTARGLWRPSMELIEEQDKRYSVEIPEPLKVPGISSKAFDAGKLLEETVQKVHDAELALIREGINALVQQRNVVEQVDSKIKESVSGMASEKEVAEKFSGMTATQWAEAPLAKKYISLFPSVEKLIADKAALAWRTDRAEKVAIAKAAEKAAAEKATADKAEAEKAAADKTAAEKAAKASTSKTENPSGIPGGGMASGGEDGKGPGGKGPGGGGPAEGEKFKPDLVIDFDCVNGKMSTRMIFPKENVVLDNILEEEDFINPEVFAGRIIKIQTFFEVWFRNHIKEDAPNDKDKVVPIYVVARIFDGRVSYGSVNVFRKCLEAALKKVDNKKLKVYWFDDFFKKDQQNKQEVPSDVREKSRSLIA